MDLILKPGLQPGAVDVFLDFISYSSGPLPEELMQVGHIASALLACGHAHAGVGEWVMQVAEMAAGRSVCVHTYVRMLAWVSAYMDE